MIFVCAVFSKVPPGPVLWRVVTFETVVNVENCASILFLPSYLKLLSMISEEEHFLLSSEDWNSVAPH